MINWLFKIVIVFMLLLSGCTKSGEIYDSSKHKKEDFSVENTGLAILGVGVIAACVAVAEDCLDGVGGSGSTKDYDWDWDYQPANSQWVCRGIQTGQYAELENCLYDVQDDDRWPG